MIMHSDGCKQHWRRTVNRPGPSEDAWGFTCTTACSSGSSTEGERLLTREQVENARNLLARAFGDAAPQI